MRVSLASLAALGSCQIPLSIAEQQACNTQASQAGVVPAGLNVPASWLTGGMAVGSPLISTTPAPSTPAPVLTSSPAPAPVPTPAPAPASSPCGPQPSNTDPLYPQWVNCMYPSAVALSPAPTAPPPATPAAPTGIAAQQQDSQVVDAYLSSNNITSITPQSVQYGMYQTGILPGTITGADVANYLSSYLAAQTAAASTSVNYLTGTGDIIPNVPDIFVIGGAAALAFYVMMKK